MSKFTQDDSRVNSKPNVRAEKGSSVEPLGKEEFLAAILDFCKRKGEEEPACAERRIDRALSSQEINELSPWNRILGMRNSLLLNFITCARDDKRFDCEATVLLLVSLLADNDGKGYCSLSVGRLAQVINRDVRNVTRALASLSARGVIIIEEQKGQSHRIRPVMLPELSMYAGHITWFLDALSPRPGKPGRPQKLGNVLNAQEHFAYAAGREKPPANSPEGFLENPRQRYPKTPGDSRRPTSLIDSTLFTPSGETPSGGTRFSAKSAPRRQDGLSARKRDETIPSLYTGDEVLDRDIRNFIEQGYGHDLVREILPDAAMIKYISQAAGGKRRCGRAALCADGLECCRDLIVAIMCSKAYRDLEPDDDLSPRELRDRVAVGFGILCEAIEHRVGSRPDGFLGNWGFIAARFAECTLNGGEAYRPGELR